MTHVAAHDLRTECGLQAVNRLSRTWNGVTVNVLEMYWSGGQGWHSVSSDLPALSMVLEETGGRYEHRIRLDQPPRTRQARAHSVNLIPARMPLWGYANNVRYVRLAKLEFDPVEVQVALGEQVALPDFTEPRLMIQDNRLWQIGALLADECARPEESDTLYGDSLVVALCVDLARLRSTPEPERERGGLAPWQVRRLAEYMDARLPEVIRLKDLAEMVELSLSHFGRAFRESFGMPPHRWHLNARIGRAQQLLLETTLPLADIALTTGFADQSHFTRSFRRQVGLTPALWRRERRS
jgi:AraC-like DNA-binding protein